MSYYMPVKRKLDSKGPFYMWGLHGKKYYYIINNKKSRENAKRKAHLQERAIYYSGYKGY
jgi:hypothetical protein